MRRLPDQSLASVRAHTYGVKRMTQSWSAASCTASHPPNFGAMAELRALAKQFESFPFDLDRRARRGIFALSGVMCPVQALLLYILCCYIFAKSQLRRSGAAP